MKKSAEDSLKSQIYKSLYKEMLEGEYPPGTIITEKELVDKYKTSKSPVREALIELINEGFLKSIPRYGYEVLAVSEDEIEAIKEVRLILEGGSLSIYFDRIKDEDIERLNALLETEKEEISLIDHWKRNTDFHMALAESYENQYLLDKLTECFNIMARAYMQYQYKRHNNKTSFKTEGTNHKLLLKAIADKNKDEALSILTSDINDFEAKS